MKLSVIVTTYIHAPMPANTWSPRPSIRCDSATVASHCWGSGSGIKSRWTDAASERSREVAILPLAKLPNAVAEETSSRNNCTATDITVNCPCAIPLSAFAPVPAGARDERRRRRRCSSSSWSATEPCWRSAYCPAASEDVEEHEDAEERDEGEAQGAEWRRRSPCAVLKAGEAASPSSSAQAEALTAGGPGSGSRPVEPTCLPLGALPVGEALAALPVAAALPGPVALAALAKAGLAKIA
eukprot:9761218-Heterocapsa_arctica.AAC.1